MRLVVVMRAPAGKGQKRVTQAKKGVEGGNAVTERCRSTDDREWSPNRSIAGVMSAGHFTGSSRILRCSTCGLLPAPSPTAHFSSAFLHEDHHRNHIQFSRTSDSRRSWGETRMSLVAADQPLAHALGDYVLHSDWMATQKTRQSFVAVVHAVTPLRRLRRDGLFTRPSDLAHRLAAHHRRQHHAGQDQRAGAEVSVSGTPTVPGLPDWRVATHPT